MATPGWFDAFRENGDPTWFGDNRTPVVFDLKIFGIGSIFLLILIAFLIILPGIRFHKLASTVTVIISFAVGAALMISLYYPGWHEGKVRIYAPFRAFTTERMDAILGVSIGLSQANVTLKSVTSTEKLEHKFAGLEYNERFELLNKISMEEEFEKTLKNGLPYPILKVIEYFSVDHGGFIWGRQYRLCGYYTYCLLWTAFGVWLIQIAMLCFVPHHFCILVLSVGILTLASDLTYIVFLPKHMQIPFPSLESPMSILEFHLSTCFYLTLTAGVTSTMFGSVLYYLEAKSIYSLKTCMSCPTDDCCCAVDESSDKKYIVDEVTLSVSPVSTRSTNCPSLDQRF